MLRNQTAAVPTTAPGSQAEVAIMNHESTSRKAWELATRIDNLKTAIFGPEPEAVGTAQGQPPSVGFFARLEDAHQSTEAAISRAHETMNLLEQRFAAK